MAYLRGEHLAFANDGGEMRQADPGRKESIGASRLIRVFFYGLFMDQEILRAKGTHPQNVRLASVSGFALRIGQRATLLPRFDSRVHGVLVDLTHIEIDDLYSEPSVRMYRPEAVIAETSDSTFIPALCFNLAELSASEEPNAEYVAKLRELAGRVGLPTEYIADI
jgi:hypothetical protein